MVEEKYEFSPSIDRCRSARVVDAKKVLIAEVVTVCNGWLRLASRQPPAAVRKWHCLTAIVSRKWEDGQSQVRFARVQYHDDQRLHFLRLLTLASHLFPVSTAAAPKHAVFSTTVQRTPAIPSKPDLLSARASQPIKSENSVMCKDQTSKEDIRIAFSASV